MTSSENGCLFYRSSGEREEPHKMAQSTVSIKIHIVRSNNIKTMQVPVHV